MSLKGSCLCQGIRYEIETELDEIIYCHCQKCRKANGTAFATNAPVLIQQFKWIQGENLLKNISLHQRPNAVSVVCVARQLSVLRVILLIFTVLELVR